MWVTVLIMLIIIMVGGGPPEGLSLWSGWDVSGWGDWLRDSSLGSGQKHGLDELGFRPTGTS